MRTIAVAIIAASIAAAGSINVNADTTTTHVTRTDKEVQQPKRHITLVRHFTPDATPTPAYVKSVILPAEAVRWGVNYWSLYNRVACETGHTFSYAADNPSSDAAGLGQFMPGTWTRALEVWSRGVRLVKQTTALVHRRVIISYSDGSRRVVRGRLVRRRVTIIRRGMLPRWPSVYHGWASARGVARALAGLGHVGAGEWACGA